MQTKPDSDNTALTSVFTHMAQYELFDNLFIGMGSKNMHRILKTISPDVRWFFINKDGEPHHAVIGKESFKKYMEEVLSNTANYTGKIGVVGWDPILEQGYVRNTYEHKPIEGKSKRVYEMILFRLKDGLISEYIPIEFVLKEW